MMTDPSPPSGGDPELSVRGIVRVLAGVAAVLVVLDLMAQTFTLITGHDYVRGWLPLFTLDKESNFGTLYAIGLLLLDATLFFVVAAMTSEDRRARRIWIFLGFVFLFLAFDEQARVHEGLIVPMRDLLPGAGIFHFGWIVPYVGLVVVVGGLVAPFILARPARIRRLFIWSTVAYVGGALGFEALGGWRMSVIGGEAARPEIVYELLTTTEEALEMTGLIILAFVQLELLRLRLGSRPVRLVE